MFKYFISVSVLSKRSDEEARQQSERFVLPTFYNCYFDDYDEAKTEGLKMIDELAKFGVEAEFCIYRRSSPIIFRRKNLDDFNRYVLD